MGADPATLAFYDGEAKDYADWSDRGSPRGWLQKFIAMLPAGGAALDLGCGGGWASAEMQAAGLHVSALDASAALAAEAEARTGVPVRVAGFEDLDEIALYDGIWASFSLLHAPKAEFPGHLRRIARALKPGGLFYIGLKEGEGEHRDGLDRFYAYYREDELRGLLAAAGFADFDLRRYEDAPGRDGSVTPIFHGIARLAP